MPLTGSEELRDYLFKNKPETLAVKPTCGFEREEVLVLKDWEEVVGLCRNAARVSPFCRSIGWDVAITQKGPVLLEGNDRFFVNQAHIDG